MNILIRNRRVNIPIVETPIESSKPKFIKWVLNGYKDITMGGYTHYTKTDWIQTLMTKINECSAQIHKAILRGGANVIECSSNLKDIFEKLEYYHVDEQQLGGRYKVIFKDNTKNVIKIYYDNPPMIIDGQWITKFEFENNTTRYIHVDGLGPIIYETKEEPINQQKIRNLMLLIKN